MKRSLRMTIGYQLTPQDPVDYVEHLGRLLDWTAEAQVMHAAHQMVHHLMNLLEEGESICSVTITWTDGAGNDLNLADEPPFDV